MRLVGAFGLVLALAACRWTSGAPLIAKDDSDWSPLKPGTYVHGAESYDVAGDGAGPVVVTTRAENDSQTYSVAFQKLGGKFFLVQAINGTEINYLILQINKEGFIQYRPDCKDENRSIAATAGATVDANEACQFPDLGALRKAAKTAVSSINRLRTAPASASAASLSARSRVSRMAAVEMLGSRWPMLRSMTSMSKPTCRAVASSTYSGGMAASAWSMPLVKPFSKR